MKNFETILKMGAVATAAMAMASCCCNKNQPPRVVPYKEGIPVQSTYMRQQPVAQPVIVRPVQTVLGLPYNTPVRPANPYTVDMMQPGIESYDDAWGCRRSRRSYNSGCVGVYINTRH